MVANLSFMLNARLPKYLDFKIFVRDTKLYAQAIKLYIWHKKGWVFQILIYVHKALNYELKIL